MEEKIVADKLYCPSSLGGGLLAMEHHLLDVASVHNLGQGHNILMLVPKCTDGGGRDPWLSTIRKEISTLTSIK